MMMFVPENVNVVADGFGVRLELSVRSRPALPVELAPISSTRCHQTDAGCPLTFCPGSKIWKEASAPSARTVSYTHLTLPTKA